VPPRTWGYPNPEAHGWERCSLPCGAARAAGRRRLRGEPGGPEPAANGRSPALRLTQWEPAALPLSNERMGAGLGCASANERPAAGRSCT